MRRTKKKKNKIVVEIILLILIAFAGVFGFKYNNLGSTEIDKVDSYILQLKEIIPNEATSDLKLPTIIKSSPNITITWTSSNDEVISNDGKLTKPSYETGEVFVTLTATFNVKNDDTFGQIFIDLLGYGEKIETFKVLVKPIDLDVKDKIDIVKEYLYIPEVTNRNIGLRTTSPLFSDLTIKWISSNLDILNNNGEIIGYGNVQLTALIEIGNQSEQITYNIEVVEEFNITEDDLHNWLNDNLILEVRNSIHLPLTTEYGGVIEWISSNENIISNEGVVSVPSSTQTVNMTANIYYFDDIITMTFQFKVLSDEENIPVEVYFIDLGKYGKSDTGESILIKYQDIEVLVDAGDYFNASKLAMEDAINTYSTDKILEYVIATHPDSDHIGGMPNIFNKYSILNVLQFNGGHSTVKYQNYVEAYQNEGSQVCNADDAYNNVGSCKRNIELGPDVSINLLNTSYYNTDETNGRSIVFILEAYETKMLLTGDADNGDGRDLEESYQDSVGDIDILKAVHHGTKEGTTSGFLQAVDPEVVIITNGNYLGNKHGHPSAEAINRIYQYDNEIKIYTVTGGNADSCELTTSYKCDGSEPMYQRNGTILVSIGKGGYNITSEYYENAPFELSSTDFWQTHPQKEYEYID